MDKREIRTRRIAWEIMKKSAYRDRRLSDVTAEIFRREGNIINDQDRRFITLLVQGTVRLSGRLDWELQQVFVGEFEDLKESLRILLRLGAYQIFYMDSVPDYAAVTTTVQLAKRIHSNLGGLTNALLRTLINLEEKNIPDENTPIETLAEYLSHPEWLINKWIKDKSFEEARLLAEWNNENPMLWFRINKREYTATKFKNYLKKHDITFEQHSLLKEFFQTSKHQELIKSDIFREGKISVQDPAAGLVVHLLAPKKNETITDACAAPGGKTSYMAELMNNTGAITAFDFSEKRYDRLNNTISRLNITNTETDIIDITEDSIDMADKLLLDVPCSGTGVMAKRADIRWRRNIDEILEMHLLQRKILWAASNFINPGGVLVYSTCSVEPEENWMVIEAFLKSHPDFKVENAKDFVPEDFVDENGAIFTFPPTHKIDGGFAVRLKKDA
ncbi:MAG: 16S rRNA (cytosine(967)-C(5))-methyltransferase RsmB [Candidatus Marinimicrobia bacterium]|nr:16S rRNA (cytosine(967)-C(5))-methyltransferase RsmB [Candidatus Neomarinimicrobiota bacterium]